MVMKMMKPSPNLIDKIKFTDARDTDPQPTHLLDGLVNFPELGVDDVLDKLDVVCPHGHRVLGAGAGAGDKWRLISTDHTLIAPHFISEPTRGIGSQPPIIRTHSQFAHNTGREDAEGEVKVTFCPYSSNI